MKNKMKMLVNRVINGDYDAFRELCALKHKDIYFWAYKTLNNHHDAEDIVQDVIMKIYNNIKSLKDVNAFNSWVYILTQNECTTLIRKNARRNEDMGCEEKTELIHENSRENIPHKWIEEEDFERYVSTLIAKLPSDRQKCFYLHYYDGLKYQEIADLLHMSKNTVGSNIRRAKAAIKDEIEKNAEYKVFFEDEEQEDEQEKNDFDRCVSK